STVYVVAPQVPGSTVLWRSTDGGITFGPLISTHQGSGDSDLAVDPVDHNLVYAVDLWDPSQNGTIPVSVSTDGASTFSPTIVLAPAGGSDRPWIATPSGGRVVIVARTLQTSQIFSWVSDDSAVTFRGPFPVAPTTPMVLATGPLVAAGDGTLYEPY